LFSQSAKSARNRVVVLFACACVLCVYLPVHVYCVSFSISTLSLTISLTQLLSCSLTYSQSRSPSLNLSLICRLTPFNSRSCTLLLISSPGFSQSRSPSLSFPVHIHNTLLHNHECVAACRIVLQCLCCVLAISLSLHVFLPHLINLPLPLMLQRVTRMSKHLQIIALLLRLFIAPLLCVCACVCVCVVRVCGERVCDCVVRTTCWKCTPCRRSGLLSLCWERERLRKRESGREKKEKEKRM